jgi:hypothetical protein
MLRDEIPPLFIEALRIFREQLLDMTEVVRLFYRFIPIEGSLDPFFNPVSKRILELLKHHECLPSVSGTWCRPNQLCTVEGDILSPGFLQEDDITEFLGLSVLHPSVQLPAPIMKSLGIAALGSATLVEILKNVTKSQTRLRERGLPFLVQWLSCFYSRLEIEFKAERIANVPIKAPQTLKPRLKELAAVPFLPCRDGSFVAATHPARVYLLTSPDKSGTSATQSALASFQHELHILDPMFVSSLEAVPDRPPRLFSELLKLLGVCELNDTKEIITKHIVPTLARVDADHPIAINISLAYLMFIKESKFDCTVSALQDVLPQLVLPVRIGAADGAVVAVPVHRFFDAHVLPLHFDKFAYNTFDLFADFALTSPTGTRFPAWSVIDTQVLLSLYTKEQVCNDKLQLRENWRTFLHKLLGVVDFIVATKTATEFRLDERDATIWRTNTSSYTALERVALDLKFHDQKDTTSPSSSAAEVGINGRVVSVTDCVSHELALMWGYSSVAAATQQVCHSFTHPDDKFAIPSLFIDPLACIAVMRRLVAGLQTVWGGYSSFLTAHCTVSVAKKQREYTIGPSTFLLHLRSLPWVPAKLDSSRLYKPSEVWVETPWLRQTVGDAFLYVFVLSALVVIMLT